MTRRSFRHHHRGTAKGRAGRPAGIIGRLAPPLAVFAASGALLVAQTPPEVPNFRFRDTQTLRWTPAAGADHYNIYRGRLSDVKAGTPPQCHAWRVQGTTFVTTDVPAAREIFLYLITGESEAGEGTPGTTSAGAPRALRGSCGPVMQAHVMNRTGFGWGEWSAARIQALGVNGYLDEQLDPASIDESDNTELASRLALHDPPADIYGLVARLAIQAIYGRRQLEQTMTAFWENHFNTYWQKPVDLLISRYPPCDLVAQPYCDPNFPQNVYREASATQLSEMETFRHLAFNGNFREIVEASARSAAMIVYLDSINNINRRPNENYARELLELYTMGVDGGYTQKDVEELARILTGWTVCYKELANADDPTAPCLGGYWAAPSAGRWVAHFDNAFIEPGVRRHDCGAKVLFEDTPHQATFPATPCLSPQEGIDELDAALDVLVAHPSTPRFISKKILQQLVTDHPTQEMIDTLVWVWNDPGNPAGIGDLREVTRAALEMAAFRDPARVGTKIRTPFEHLVASMRATRASTDGVTFVFNYLVTAQHIPFYNDVPTGYPETGADWIDTNGTLTRQNFALNLTSRSEASFGSDPVALLGAHGIAAAPGNEAAIVDFFGRILFGGALTPADRQAAITFLSTNDVGTPSPLHAARIRDTVALMLGYPQFQEQ